PGDHANLRLSAQLIGQDYVWRWQTTVRRGHSILAEWDQSNFLAEPRGMDRLRRSTRTARPKLNDAAKVLPFVLRHLDGHTPLEAIANRIQRAFPNHFPSSSEAFERVSVIAADHGC